MRILIVSNLYPPHYLGGYEIRCAQVAEALQGAGHHVEVITSGYGVGRGPFRSRSPEREMRRGVAVHRCLREYIFPALVELRPWAYFQARRELEDVREFQRVVQAFRPDLISWWSLYGLSKLLMPLPRRWRIPDVCWIEQSWMIDQYGAGGSVARQFWHDFFDGKWGMGEGNALTRAIGRRWERRAIRDGIETREFESTPCHVCFVSEFIARMHREAGLRLPSSEVIYGGVSTDEFLAPVRPANPARALRLLYAGQLTPDRGLHTIVEALVRLPPQARDLVTLRVAGDGQKGYLAGITARVEGSGLAGRVSFAGRVAHAGMAEVYRAHDLLIFPSERDEGLPLAMIEAMLSGCAVVTTGAGGSAEIAAQANLPTFPRGDAAALAALLTDFVANRADVTGLATRGQEVAVREFSFDRMFGRFLTTVERVAAEQVQ